LQFIAVGAACGSRDEVSTSCPGCRDDSCTLAGRPRALHGVGLVHRDIKPGNLMICRRGGIPDFVKVMDVGLVKEISTEALARREPITQSASTVIGTPLYLAPEAISRPAEVDTRADLYALGAVAYFLLVGEPVFDGETVLTVLQ
jgi:serine/threonine protein kinase